jgi:hypothetical protein
VRCVPCGRPTVDTTGGALANEPTCWKCMLWSIGIAYKKWMDWARMRRERHGNA